MADPFRLPRLKTLDRIVDNLGRPSIAFIKFFNVDFAGAIERQEVKQAETDARQDAVDQELIELNDVQDMLIEDLAETQQTLVEAVADIQSILGIVTAQAEAVQSAAVAANQAQATADAAGGTATSGEATDPSINLTTADWVLGPQVDLTGLAAGTLTIIGTGPLQDSDVGTSNIPSTVACEFRVVEIVGGVDEVLFTGEFTVQSYTDKFGQDTTIVTNRSSTAVAAFSSARTSTGAVSYRIDARRLTNINVFDLQLYIVARRVP